MTTLADRIKSERTAKGLTQEELGKFVGVGKSSVSQWESGQTKKMDGTNMVLTAKALGVNPDWLATGKGEKLKDQKIETIEPGETYQPVRFVSFDLKAGISGYGVDYLDEENEPLYFRAAWFQKRRLKPANIVACSVSGESMEPTLYSGDVVLVDLSNTTLIDGDVFAVNYEGEMVIKRMHRDAGQWYLQSDNLNKTRYPNKLCSGDLCLIIGKIVHRQSEKI